MQYRKELDGLRALAVFAVIIYHANISAFGAHLFQGGLFGVDVFFVLSGFLITGIIRHKMESNSFSFIDFYWRRAKRIIPALLFMLVVTSCIAYFILLPDDLVKYAKSLKSTLYFGSNYFFLNEDSYVSDASIYKPLLHTWSLSVEWQFYMIFPVIVWLINKFFKPYLFSILLCLSIFSLQYAQFIVPNYPDSAFYLLPSRAWELMLGGLVTFFNRNNINNVASGTLESILYKSLPIIGLFMIVHSMLFIGHEVLHPSFVTLIPVLGTCLFIMFTKKGELTCDIFSLKPIVFVGTISYSLYLWHQPIFVFFRFLKHDYFRPEQLILLVSLSLVIATISLKLIENPFRAPDKSKKKFMAIISVIVIAFSLSSYTVSSSGFPNRLKGIVKTTFEVYKQPEFRRLTDPSNPGTSLRTGGDLPGCNIRSPDTACRFGDESWVTIGDSYLGQFDFTLLEKLRTKGQGMISLAYEQCPFVVDNVWYGNVPECTIVNKKRWEVIRNFKNNKNILIAANYYQFFKTKSGLEDPIKARKNNQSGGTKVDSAISWQSYADNINKLADLGHNVYVIYPIPQPGTDVKKVVFSQIDSLNPKFKSTLNPDVNAYKKATELELKLDSYLKDRPNLHKIHSKDILCPDKKCLIVNHSGGLYNFGAHLSYFGANLILNESKILD